MSSHEITRQFVLRRKGAPVDGPDSFWSHGLGVCSLGDASVHSPSEAILRSPPYEGYEWWPVDVICAASAEVAHLSIVVGRDGPPEPFGG